MFRFSAVCLVFSAILLTPALAQESAPQPNYAKALVLDSKNIEIDSLTQQQATLKVTSGKFKNKTVTVKHLAVSPTGVDLTIKKGDRVILWVEEEPSYAESPSGEPLFIIADFQRDTAIFWLAGLYILTLIIFGGLKGVKSLLSLIIVISLIFLVLFPLILKGANPLLVSILVSALASIITFRIIGGKTIKSFSAASGTIIGVALAGLIATVAGNLIHLSGLTSEESKILFYSLNMQIDFKGILFASILIGALGAIMDIGMSIASSIEEVKRAHPQASALYLFKSGMNIGGDVMGTMANTLILAYTGSALPLLLLFVSHNVDLLKILNLEMIASEALRALAGSIGLVLCIPVTAGISALVYWGKGKG